MEFSPWYGRVNDGEEILSIHKMSAKFLNKSNNNGRDYFFVIRKDGLVSINDLRCKYFEEHVAEEKCKKTN